MAAHTFDTSTREAEAVEIAIEFEASLVYLHSSSWPVTPT